MADYTDMPGMWKAIRDEMRRLTVEIETKPTEFHIVVARAAFYTRVFRDVYAKNFPMFDGIIEEAIAQVTAEVVTPEAAN